MAKSHDQKYFLKKCAQCLAQIEKLPKDQHAAFAILKRKAMKYLARARDFEKK